MQAHALQLWPEHMDESVDPSVAHLLGRLAALEARVRGLVAWRRSLDAEPDDPYRGLYVSDAHVDRLLAPRQPDPDTFPQAVDRHREAEARADEAAAAGETLRLRRLADSFDLSPLDVDILIAALAPDLDPRFEKLYGYLHDDITRRRASPGLALELAGGSPFQADDRARFLPTSPLVAGELVAVEGDDRPLLTRSLRVPERVLLHLLGDDRPDPTVEPLVRMVPPASDAITAGLGRVLRSGGRLVYLRHAGAVDHGLEVGAGALRDGGWPALTVDLGRSDTGMDLAALARRLGTEARLRHAGLVAGPLDVLVETGAVAALRWLAELRWPVVLTGSVPWDPPWSADVPLLVTLERPNVEERHRRWRATLNGAASDVGSGDASLEVAAAGFRLGPGQIERAARAAQLEAARAGEPVSPSHLAAGVRAQNAAGLERLARRVEPTVRWDDLVLPVSALALLDELRIRACYRGEIKARWGLGGGGADGKGVTALFSGPPGTGKTMAAEVIAGSLGLDLYVVDLATVVDKYIGETEKNLDRVFREAEGVSGILFFDEADALFGKRSEVSDARDRYANLEVAYLLQRMESFGGLAILATNLGANLDEAFFRRLDAVVEFPMPDASARRRLWDLALGERLPRAADLDLAFCADAFELSGGHIRNIGLTAAFLARHDEQPVAMAHLITATQREYRKLGRLCLPSEFGPYHRLVAAGAG